MENKNWEDVGYLKQKILAWFKWHKWCRTHKNQKLYSFPRALFTGYKRKYCNHL